MAPEMLGGGSERLSERTDVYLLGSILYEIVTGHPPHRGEALMAIVSSIVQSEPDIPDDVPEELARIIVRAMDRDPDARFERADQIRLALQGFLQHRAARQLADLAEAKRRDMLAAIEGIEGEHDPDVASVYDLFGECRFGFQHALEVWPENETAAENLERAFETMVLFELTLGRPESASVLLAQMRSVPEPLRERVASVRETHRARRAKLAKLSDEHDPTIGRRTRWFVATVFGLVWTVVPLALQIGMDRGFFELTFEAEISFTLLLTALLCGLGFWARESLLKTAMNRTVVFGAGLAIGADLVNHLVGWIDGRPITEAAHESFLAWGSILAMIAFGYDRRMFPAAAAFFVAYLVVSIAGAGYTFYVMAAANGTLLLSVMLLWSRPKEDIGYTRDRLRERLHDARLRSGVVSESVDD